MSPPPLLGEMFALKTFRLFKPPLKPPTKAEDPQSVVKLPPPSISATDPPQRKGTEDFKISPPSLVEKLPISFSKKAPRCSVCKILVKGHQGQVGKGKCLNGRALVGFIERAPKTSSHQARVSPSPPSPAEDSLSLGLSTEDSDHLLETLRSPPTATFLQDLDDIGDLLDIGDNIQNEPQPHLGDLGVIGVNNEREQIPKVQPSVPTPTNKGDTKKGKVKSTKRSSVVLSDGKAANKNKKQKTSGLSYFAGYMNNIFSRKEMLTSFETGGKKSSPPFVDITSSSEVDITSTSEITNSDITNSQVTNTSRVKTSITTSSVNTFATVSEVITLATGTSVNRSGVITLAAGRHVNSLATGSSVNTLPAGSHVNSLATGSGGKTLAPGAEVSLVPPPFIDPPDDSPSLSETEIISLLTSISSLLEEESTTPSVLVSGLLKLAAVPVTVPALLSTGVGKAVRRLKDREGKVGRLAGKLVSRWRRIALQYEPQPSTTGVGQAVSDEVTEEPVAALLQAGENVWEVGSSEGGDISIGGHGSVFIEVESINNDESGQVEKSGDDTLASGSGWNSMATGSYVDTSVTGSGVIPPVTNHGTLSDPENRIPGNSEARAGKRGRKCKDLDCVKCKIDINCGNCESCMRPEMKLKCVERLVFLAKYPQ